jgi:DNA-binding response OmpR family regulator
MPTTFIRQILVIEDDHDIANLVQIHLRDIGYNVDLAHEGTRGLEQAQSQPYDLIILDLMLPGLQGLDICQRLRAKPHYAPIVMLTAKSSELDRVLGLELGADDYITKPFNVRELIARVKAIFRRIEALSSQSKSEAQKAIQIGALMIELEKHKVTLAGECINLTAKEFDLLVQFAQHPGRVYMRSELLDLVWGKGYEGYEHTVNTHINRLRMKIEKDAARPHYLLTVWGVGYKFVDAEGR